MSEPVRQSGRLTINALSGRPNLAAYLLLTFTALFWGGNSVAGRVAVGEISPMMLTSIRWAFVLVFVALLARRDVVASWPALRPRLLWTGAVGVCGLTFYNALFYVAAHYTTAVNLAILQGSVPVFVLAGAYLFHGAAIRLVQVSGIVLTLLGVAVITTKGNLHALLEMQFNFGDLLILLASVLQAIYTLALHKRPKVPAIAFFCFLAGAAFISSIPLVGVEAALGEAQWPTVTGWAVVAFVAVCPSFLAQVFLLRGVELIGPSRAALFSNLVPVFGPILAIGLLHEPFGPYHAIGLVCVIGGIMLAEIRA